MFKVLLSLLLLLSGCASISLSELATATVLVSIEVDGKEIGSGSGVIVGCYRTSGAFELKIISAKHLLTNRAVYSISSARIEKTLLTDIIIPNNDLDFIIFKCKYDKYIEPAKIEKSSSSFGLDVIAIGYPAGIGLVITKGVVAGYRENNRLCSADTFPGSSGGPVFDASTGRIVGITIQVGAMNLDTPIGRLTIPISFIHIMLPSNRFYDYL